MRRKKAQPTAASKFELPIGFRRHITEKASSSLIAAFRYAEDAATDTILVNKWVRLAAQRFLRMAASTDAEHEFVAFYPEMFFTFCAGCTHVKGRWSGEPFLLAPWQALLVSMIYGFRRRSDTSVRYTTLFFIFLPRKSGKSAITSLIALFELRVGSGGKLPSGQYERGNEVFTVALDLAQSHIIWDASWSTCGSMVPELAAKFKRSYLKIQSAGDPMSQFKALSKNFHTTADGKSPQCALIDEAAQITNRIGIDVLESGFGARRNPILGYLTTASHTRDTRFFDDYQLYKNILSGAVEDSGKWQGLLYEMDEADDWEDEKNWYKVSPMLGITISLEFLREQYKLAKLQIVKQAEFKTKYLNCWVSSSSPFLDPDLLDKCPKGYPMEGRGKSAVKKEPVARYLSFDLASTRDLNAICVIHQFDDESFWFDCRYFLPQEGFDRIPPHYKPIFFKAKTRGSLELTPGRSIDFRFIHEYILAKIAEANIDEIAYDSYNSSWLVQQLEAHGYPMKDVGQSVRVLNAPTKLLEKLILDGKRLHHEHDPFFKWQLANCQLWIGTEKTNTNQNIKLIKNPDDQHAKIDGIIALVMGLYSVLDNSILEIADGITELDL